MAVIRKSKDIREQRFIDHLSEINKLTGRSWKLVIGNPRVSCQYLLKTDSGNILCESNMISTLHEFLRGVEVGFDMESSQQ